MSYHIHVPGITWFVWNNKSCYDFRYVALRDVGTIQYHNFASEMKVARSKYVPPVPRNLTDLAATLENYHPIKNFYKGCAVASDGSVGLIFINDEMLQPLSNCKHLFTDGTFKVRNADYNMGSYNLHVFTENCLITDET